MTSQDQTNAMMPQSPDGEKGLLSSFLINPREVGRLCAERQISTGHFAIPAHATIYAILLGLWSEDRPIDFIILTQLLIDKGQLGECGGAAYVTEIFTFLPTAANATRYIDILCEKKTLRDIIQVCTRHAGRSYAEQDDFAGVLADVQSEIASIGTHSARLIPTMRQNVIEAITSLQDRLADSPSILRTGLAALDNDVGPCERGMLLVIGGQSKSGKSIIAGQIALNVAFDGKPVLFISLEMSEREITLRWLAALSRVNTRQPGMWSEADHDRFNVAQSRLVDLPITVVTRTYQLSEIVAHCQQAAAKPGEPLAVIVLDYAQLTSAMRNGREDRRQQEIAEISRTCKRLAGKLNVLFILLTQLNDEGRSREARDIENDANLMLEVGHNKENGERGVKVVLARSAPMGQRLKLRIMAEYTRVEDAPDMEFTEEEPKRKGRSARRWND